MANDFLTVQQIARQALLRLQNNLVLAGLVHRDHSNEFASFGDTIQVRKPATFEAKDFTSGSSTTDAQDIEEDKVLVKLDKIADVTVEVTSKQLALNLDDFGEQIVEGAMQALAQKIDNDLAGLYTAVPYYSGTPGNTPDALSHIAQARKTLNENKAPFGNRRLLVDPEADAELLVLDAVASAAKSGSTDALREASLGRLLGFDTFMSQNTRAHTKGDLAAASGDIVVESEVDAGATEMTLETGSDADLTGSLKAGDLFSIADNDQQFVVTEDADADTTDDEIAIKFYPATAETIDAGKEATIQDTHVANLGFHRNALALVNRPLALPMGGAEGEVVNYNGLSVRVTQGYTMSSKVNTISFDILYGVKCLQPELAVRMFGTA